MNSMHVTNLLQIFVYEGAAFAIASLFFPDFIRFAQDYKLTQRIRKDGLSGGAAKLFQKLHIHKAGTPTMGGAVIIFAVLATVVISRVLAYFGVIDHSILNRGETYLPIITLTVVGILGLVDDYLNIRERSSQKGLSS